MPNFRLRDDLSYCRIDGRLIFLDIRHDRYFRLADCLESALETFLAGGVAPEGQVRKLLDQGILVERQGASSNASPPCASTPTRSATEEDSGIRRSSFIAMLDTLAIVCSTQLQLKVRGLKNVLVGLEPLRSARASRSSTSCNSEARVLNLAAAFRHARMYVPVDTCCLLDSIAMARFLAKRGVRTDLVFGVTADPFSAHCWVQYGTIVLNDALGHALAHTPIRVI